MYQDYKDLLFAFQSHGVKYKVRSNRRKAKISTRCHSERSEESRFEFPRRQPLPSAERDSFTSFRTGSSLRSG